MKKSSMTPTMGGGSNNNKNCTVSSSYSSTKGPVGSFKAETKYSLQSGGAGAKDKYSSEQKYSSKNATTETKYSSQAKYSASNKSVERRDNEANAARERDRKDKKKDDAKEADTRTKFLSENKYATPAAKEPTKSTWASSTTDTGNAKKSEPFSSSSSSANNNNNKFKYSTEERWSSKNFSAADGSARTFSSQTSTSSWEERNRGRAFPYDRDHELRRSQSRYDADGRNLDPKYRKAAALTGLVSVPLSGVAPGRGVDYNAGAGATREDHAAATGCHNCTLL